MISTAMKVYSNTDRAEADSKLMTLSTFSHASLAAEDISVKVEVSAWDRIWNYAWRYH